MSNLQDQFVVKPVGRLTVPLLASASPGAAELGKVRIGDRVERLQGGLGDSMWEVRTQGSGLQGFIEQVHLKPVAPPATVIDLQGFTDLVRIHSVERANAVWMAAVAWAETEIRAGKDAATGRFGPYRFDPTVWNALCKANPADGLTPGDIEDWRNQVLMAAIAFGHYDSGLAQAIPQEEYSALDLYAAHVLGVPAAAALIADPASTEPANQALIKGGLMAAEVAALAQGAPVLKDAAGQFRPVAVVLAELDRKLAEGIREARELLGQGNDSSAATSLPVQGGPVIVIGDRELDLLSRVANGEVGNFGKHGQDQLEGGVAGVVDTILNRVAHPDYPNSLDAVVDQPKQFSPINGLGTWSKLKKAPSKIVGLVAQHLAERVAGKPSAIRGATHFLNPHVASPSAMKDWGQHVVDNAVKFYGDESKKDVHYHGFAPGGKPPPDYAIAFRQTLGMVTGVGAPLPATGSTVDRIIASAEKEWTLWGRSTWDLIQPRKAILHRDEDPGFTRCVLDNYCACVGATPTLGAIADDKYPWSAVAISFMLMQAGIGSAQFKFAQSHSVFIRDAIARGKAGDTSAAYWGFRIDDPRARPEPGDLIGYPRAKGLTHSKALAYFDRTGDYKSHTDIVVAKRPGAIEVIGGNVSDSVTKKTIAIDGDGVIRDRQHPWFVVLKLRL